MAVASFVPVLADLVNPFSGLSAAGFAGASLAVVVLLFVFIGLPLYFIITSFPLWLAAKIAISGETTYIVAIKVIICQFLAWILTTVVGWGVVAMGAMIGGQAGVGVVLVLLFLVSIFVALSITSNAYGIGLLHAFGVQILGGLLVMIMMTLALFACSMFVGMSGALAPFRMSYEKLEQARQSGDYSTLTSPFSQPTPPPEEAAPPLPSDYTAEIDHLLNAALHPDGPAPSLTEREDIVRMLQQKLRAQRSNMTSGDTRAVAVYQNQMNRYLMLLDQVKAERRLHPLDEASGSPQVAR